MPEGQELPAGVKAESAAEELHRRIDDDAWLRLSGREPEAGRACESR
jgi:hypothetical protein